MGELATIGACCAALPATLFRLARPRRPDSRFFSSLDDAGAPAATNHVTVTALPQASQQAPMPLVVEGAFSPRRAQMGMASFLVEHPDARLIVDPALCADVHDTVLGEMSATFRALVAPDKPVVGLAELLSRRGLEPGDVDLAVATHLHWDHVSGLRELPEGVVLTTVAAERDFAASTPTPYGVITGPLTGREMRCVDLDGPPVLTFARSHDMFGDGSVVLVDLAGHTPGSVGVLLALDGGRRILLVGDAVWNVEQARRIREKAPLPGNLVDADRDEAFRTIHRLHALPADVVVVPSHDRLAVESISR